MPLVAIAAWLVYLSLAFGYRSYAQLRATGRTGFVGFTHTQTMAERLAGMLFALALVVGMAAPVLGLTFPDHALTRALVHVPWPVFAGALLFVSGLVLTLLAQFTMGKSWRIGVDTSERTELVMEGAFVLVRNPIFTAMALTGAGIVLLYPSWLAGASYAALLVALQLQVRFVEEPYLRRTHGPSYERYASRVGRFVPGVGLLR